MSLGSSRPWSGPQAEIDLPDEVLARRPVPAWLEVSPTQMRILVHSVPERGAIDTAVQEQLIVELYSK